MKKILPILSIVFAMLVFLSVSGRAQSLPCTNPDEVPVNTMTVETRLTGDAGTTLTTAHDVVSYRAQDGQIIHRILTETIRFTSGDPRVADQTSTFALFTALSKSTVLKGLELRFPACSQSCLTPSRIVVRHALCVTRYESGLATRFEPCPDTECGQRKYEACCENGGAPQITMVDSTTSPCAGGVCEGTCPPPLGE